MKSVSISTRGTVNIEIQIARVSNNIESCRHNVNLQVRKMSDVKVADDYPELVDAFTKLANDIWK